MSQAQLAAASERLPWLSDDKVPAARTRRKRDRLLAGAAAIAAVAALSYWLGARSWDHSDQGVHHSMTVALPPAAPPAPEIAPERVPEVAPVVQPTVGPTPRPEVHITRPQRIAPPVAPRATEAPAVPPSVVRSVAVAPPASVARSGPLPLWPARVSTGAYGRLVQIGAFGTRLQAKRGWKAMVRAYPAVSHLPAVVVGARNSRGRGFYRFQIGTTSQAHSEVLCQRMEKIRMSCAVVGLPWKPGGVER
jgi:hypothetical protein